MCRAFDHIFEPCSVLFSDAESCSVKFDLDQTFHLPKSEQLNISFVSLDAECCSVGLTTRCSVGLTTLVQLAHVQCFTSLY